MDWLCSAVERRLCNHDCSLKDLAYIKLMTTTSSSHIQVCCRIRAAEDGQPTISAYLNADAPGETSRSRCYEVTTAGNGSFQMDYAFDHSDSQECIFDRIVQPLLTDAFAGFNCSLFSYGQTGSGKTYTLVGNPSFNGSLTTDNKERGIIPRAAEMVFAKQASLDPTKVTCQVRLSILEVYQEQLRDLLRAAETGQQVTARDTAGLRIREQIDGTVWVENLTEVPVTEGEEFNRLLTSALKRRVVGAHNMNEVSSRSHFCCILNINQVIHTTGVKMHSKVHFIDLAGSEMVGKTDATGVRFTEARHINKSLSALGNVIYALSGGASRHPSDNNMHSTMNSSNHGDSTPGGPSGGAGLSKSQQLHRASSSNSLTSTVSGGATATGGAASVTNGGANGHGRTHIHIPYRDSKLTRLLQNSLGGNAKTVIILTVSDAKRHLSETLSTLRFGARARQIQTRAVANRSILEDQAQMKKNYTKAVQENVKLQELVAELQAELHQLRQQKHSACDSDTEDPVCEVCRNFLNLKLRTDSSTHNNSAATAAAAAPKNHPPRSRPSSIREDAPPLASAPHSGSNPASGLPSPTVSSATAATLPNLGAASLRHSASGTDSPDEYSLQWEPPERCAICGLSADESDKLQAYTGEVLGEMFSCDGNCGHQFHVRCVGLVGDGGQYTLPEGEWFCTECYSACETQDSLTLLRPPSMDLSSVGGVGAAGGVGGGGSGGGGGIALSAGSPGRAGAGTDGGGGSVGGDGDNDSAGEGGVSLYRSLSSTDMNAMAAESLRNAPNKNPSSVLATIKAEYHAMRKERNRILAQWQQEKRIIEKYEITRRIEQQKRDKELINAKETIQQLENLVAQGEAQSARMGKLFDVMLKELQLSTSNMTNTMNSTNSSAALRHSADRLKWASLTVESLLAMPIDRDTEVTQDPPSPSRYAPTQSQQLISAAQSPSPKAGSFSRSPKGLQHSATSPNLQATHTGFFNTSTAFHTSSSLLATAAATSAGIPKPWKAKPRTGGVGGVGGEAVATAAKQESTTSNGEKGRPAGTIKASGGAVASGGSSPRTAATAAAASRALTVSTTRSPSGGGKSNAATTGAGVVSAENSPVAATKSHDTSSRSSHSDAPTATTQPLLKGGEVSPGETAPRRKLSDQSDSSSESSRGKSKFINPLKNRLKDLLRSVEAEADAFAEIRQKFKSREEERNQLRNSSSQPSER